MCQRPVAGQIGREDVIGIREMPQLRQPHLARDHRPVHQHERAPALEPMADAIETHRPDRQQYPGSVAARGDFTKRLVQVVEVSVVAFYPDAPRRCGQGALPLSGQIYGRRAA